MLRPENSIHPSVKMSMNSETFSSRPSKE